MTRGLAYTLVGLFATLGVITGMDGIALGNRLQEAISTTAAEQAAQGNVREAVQPFISLVEWLKVIGGLVGMALGGLGVWVYYRTTTRTKTNEALNATVDIYKGQIDALMARDDMRERDLKEALMAQQEREKEMITLRARTDLSEVLKALQLMTQAQTTAMKESTERSNFVSETLTQFMKSSEERYGTGIKLMTSLLETNAENSKQAVVQATRNHEAISMLLKSVDSLSRRFGSVEHKVDNVQRAVSDAADDAQEEAAQKRDAEPPHPERRKRSR